MNYLIRYKVESLSHRLTRKSGGSGLIMILVLMEGDGSDTD